MRQFLALSVQKMKELLYKGEPINCSTQQKKTQLILLAASLQVNIKLVFSTMKLPYKHAYRHCQRRHLDDKMAGYMTSQTSAYRAASGIRQPPSPLCSQLLELCRRKRHCACSVLVIGCLLTSSGASARVVLVLESSKLACGFNIHKMLVKLHSYSRLIISP